MKIPPNQASLFWLGWLHEAFLFWLRYYSNYLWHIRLHVNTANASPYLYEYLHMEESIIHSEISW